MAGAISLVNLAAQTQDDRRGALIQKITNESLFLRLLMFVNVDGFGYEYAEQTTLPSVAFRSINEEYSATVGVVNPKIEQLGIFGGEVQTDRQLMQVRNGIARTNAILAMTAAAGLGYDKCVIDGDPNVNAKEFWGLNARLTGDQVIAAGDNGAALTLAMVDNLLDAVAGPNEEKVLVMCKADRTKMKQLIVAAAGGAAVADIGKRAESYDGAKIESIDEDGGPTAILDKDETQGSSNVTSSMYCIRPGKDPEGEWVQGLSTPKLIEHSQQGERGTKFYDLIEMRAGLGVFHGRAAARLKGIL